MAAELLQREPTARDIFGRAGEVLGLDLAGVCTTGNDTLLTRTDIAQPALLTTCVAWLAAVRSRGLDAAVLAGHSLGEFTAWVGSGAIEFEAALRLVRRRSELMAEAAQRNPGGMTAVIGLPDDRVIEICTQAESIGAVVPANFNSPGQLVVSGTPDALDRVAQLATAAGGRAMPLRVAGAFHSPLMDDAAREFSRLVAAAAIADPRIPVVANVSAEPVTDADSVRSAISRQMTSPVLWTDSVRRMVADGVSLFLEVGPGKVLTNLIQRISTDARTVAVGSLDALETLSQEVNP